MQYRIRMSKSANKILASSRIRAETTKIEF